MERDWSAAERAQAQAAYRTLFGEQAAERWPRIEEMERWIRQAYRRISPAHRRGRDIQRGLPIIRYRHERSSQPPAATLENRLYSLFAE